MQDTGRRGKSRRPSGEKDASAHTGVDPQERKGGDPSHRVRGARALCAPGPRPKG